MRPTELARVLTAQVPEGSPGVDVRVIRRHLDLAGLRIGDGRRINLFAYAAWLRRRGLAEASMAEASTATEGEAYARHAARQRERQAAISAAGRNIGPTARIANPRRRERCRLDLGRFCRTYNPRTFYWRWSRDHKAVIAALEETVLRGGLLAYAMPRGSGKSSLCRMGVLWAVSYAHTPYAFLIGANEEKALEGLEAVKAWIGGGLPNYAADFPEIAGPVAALGGIVTRAAGQHQDGVATMIQWRKDRVVLPRVMPPPNLRPVRRTPNPAWDGYAPSSGAVVGVSGLTGEGIRGSLFGHPDGRSVRPDLIVLDDPQTDESADSPVGNQRRERLIRGAVLGMAGPGKRVRAIMPCTVIRPGDMVDRLLDRKRNPLWRGVRTRLLETMPANLPAWEEYFEVYRECMGRSQPDIRPANRYYRKHRRTLDAGAKAAWPARKGEDEVSPIQHAMNLYCERGAEAWWAEFQNEPQRDDRERDQLTPELVAEKLNQLPRGVAATAAEYVSAYIDVHDRLLYWAVAAWSPTFEGGLIDYGAHPKQPTRYFAQTTAPRSLGRRHPKKGKEGAIREGLTELVDRLLAAEWKREDGAVLRIGRLLIDGRYQRDLVETFCRRSPHAALILPALGFFVPRGREWRDYFASKEGGQTGHHWRVPPPKRGSRYVLIDANYWKTLAWERLRVALGDSGCWSLFGREPREHQLIADHCCAERAVWVEAKGLGRFEWEWKEGRPDNHWWDCFTGCGAAAAMMGVAIPGVVDGRRGPVRRKKRVQYLEL